MTYEQRHCAASGMRGVRRRFGVERSRRSLSGGEVEPKKRMVWSPRREGYHVARDIASSGINLQPRARRDFLQQDQPEGIRACVQEVQEVRHCLRHVLHNAELRCSCR